MFTSILVSKNIFKSMHEVFSAMLIFALGNLAINTGGTYKYTIYLFQMRREIKNCTKGIRQYFFYKN